MKKILFKGGTLVSPRGTKRADILVSGEKILAVGKRLSADAQIIDVSGRLIFPGFVDAHTHFGAESGGAVSVDHFRTGTAGALAGGVTTVVDFALQGAGETLTDALNNRHVDAFANSDCDYAFHMTIHEWNEQVRRELPAMFEQGVTSFKAMASLSDGDLFDLMTELKKHGGIVGFCCEDSALTEKLTELLIKRGENSPAGYAKAHPDYAEAAGINRFLSIARAAQAPCIVMLSSAAGYEEVLRARNNGVKAYAETCVPYLLLDDSAYDAPFEKAARFVCAPPLRKPEDKRVLWEGFKRDRLDAIGSGHCAFTMEQKIACRDDLSRIPAGMPGTEELAQLVYTYGVRKKRISVQQMCAYLSENPARLYGLYPKKGALKAGSDADIIVFNPKASGVIAAAKSHCACDYSPYEGARTEGGIEKVFLRGKLVCSNGEITQPHIGRFITRGKSGM